MDTPLGGCKCGLLVRLQPLPTFNDFANRKAVITMIEGYRESVLTRYAKECAWGAKRLIDGICMSEEISKTELGRTIAHGWNGSDELIMAVAKRFAKLANDRQAPDVETGEVQEFCDIIQKIVECCEENDWFGY